MGRAILQEGRMWAAVLLDAALMNGNHSGHSEPRGIFLHLVSWKAVQCNTVP